MMRSKWLLRACLVGLLACLSTSAFAANVTFLEPGTDATLDLTFWRSVQGTTTSDSSQTHTGPRSLETATDGISTAAAFSQDGILADAGRRISFWFRFHQITAVSGRAFAVVAAVGDTQVGNVGLLTTAKLNLFLNGPGSVAGSTVLSVDTWYRITFAYSITSATVFTFKVYLNGALEISQVNTGTLGLTGTSNFQVDCDSNWGAGAINWFDDIYIDDASDASDPGNIRVTAKRPFSNGTTTGFTTQIGSGGSGYGSGHTPQINERPLNTANGWSMVVTGSAITEEYSLETNTAGDVNVISAAIVGVQGWLYAKALASETGQIIVDGTSSNISLTSTNTLFTKNSATPTVYPAGTGTDIGLVTATTSTTVSLYEGGIIVAYIPSARRRTLLGVGQEVARVIPFPQRPVLRLKKAA